MLHVRGNKISVRPVRRHTTFVLVNRIKRAKRSCKVRTSVKRGYGDKVTITFSGYMARRCRARGFTMAVTDPANTMYSAIQRIWKRELKGNINTQFMVGATPPNARPCSYSLFKVVS